MLDVGGNAQARAGETLLAHVTAPAHGVAFLQGFVDGRHHLVKRDIPAGTRPPLVRRLDDKLLVERVVGKTHDAHIVLLVDAQHLGKRRGRVLLALKSETLGALAQVGVEDALQAHFPLRRQLGAVAFGNGFHVRLQRREELGEVGQRVADHRAGARHGLLGANAVTADDLEHVVGRAAF